MNFSGFIRKEDGAKISFSTLSPLIGIYDIKYYQDDSKGPFSKKEFRWSFNGDYWSSWEILNQGNISSIKIGGNKQIFLEIRYLSSGGSVTSFTINYNGEPQIVDNNCNTCQPDSQYKPINKNIDNSDDIQCKYNTDSDHIDVETLCGKDSNFYLWRPNHKGTQPISSISNLSNVLNKLASAVTNVDIKSALNVDGDGIGVYYKLDNKTLYFKRIQEGNKIFVSETSDGIISISADDSSINDLFFHIGNLNGVNIGGSSGEIFKHRINDDFQFRTIAAGSTGISIQTVGDRIVISADASISGELWVDSDPISATIGGARSGDIFDGSTSIRVLEKMLYEYFPPKVNLNINPSSGYYEKWNPSILAAQLFGNFNNHDFVKVRVTDISAYVSVNNMPAIPINILPTNISYPDVSEGSFIFNDSSFPNWEDVVYNLKFYNNANYKSMPAFDVSIDLKFIEPYIWGVVDDTINKNNINATILEDFKNSGQKLILPKKSNEIDFIRPNGMFKIKFVYAYPENYGGLRSIMDTKNDFNVMSSFDYLTLNIDLGAPTLIPYSVYIKSHWIDTSSFKLIFNI